MPLIVECGKGEVYYESVYHIDGSVTAGHVAKQHSSRPRTQTATRRGLDSCLGRQYRAGRYQASVLVLTRKAS
jgi:hypothetical protein